MVGRKIWLDKVHEDSVEGVVPRLWNGDGKTKVLGSTTKVTGILEGI